MMKGQEGKISSIIETIKGIVSNITYHNPENGWSVLRVQPFNNPHQNETVIVHQMKVFAGATMEFRGNWTTHPKFGRQFKATEALEKKPATTAALEKYLGSGLIKGVGPKTAKKIVHHFGSNTLDIFEEQINKLTDVPGIAKKKLSIISDAWTEHREIREVMIFLQSHNISTLFAVRIYKEYGNDSIRLVTENPYRIADDFYGIGFLSADKVALSIGLEKDSIKRIVAGIRHVLSASREFGHCYLTESQIKTQVEELLELKLQERLPGILNRMEKEGLLVSQRAMASSLNKEQRYYSKSLYFDERYVGEKVKSFGPSIKVDTERIDQWVERYCKTKSISLSEEQAIAVKGVVSQKFSILTGGPGVGKTTCTLVLVRLLEVMQKKVLLTAPTGRAAQRMTDVIGRESKTIHRLLGWKMGQFQRNEESPLECDFLIVDESSMLDITITASLLKAVKSDSHILFIGDSDQLPSVGAGNVLKDLIGSRSVKVFNLTQVFRQAKKSSIIRYSHQINRGTIPHIESPFNKPESWSQGVDCIFMDAEEATQEQIGFIKKVKRYMDEKNPGFEENSEVNPYEFRMKDLINPYESELNIPDKFLHVDIEKLSKTQDRVEELKGVLKKLHPWSSLKYGLTASDIVKKLYIEWIPKYRGKGCEIQILSPMTRGSLGTVNLNKIIQEAANPPQEGKRQIKLGERVLREGDRVIHRKNNYDLNVFNGDIGTVKKINIEELTCVISFFSDKREVLYQKEHIIELDLAYAITIHKSQGSEFEAVIIPVLTQHFKMLYRNLIYTGLTRAKKMAIFVGTRRAFAMAVKNMDTSERQTALQEVLQS